MNVIWDNFLQFHAILPVLDYYKLCFPSSAAKQIWGHGLSSCYSVQLYTLGEYLCIVALYPGSFGEIEPGVHMHETSCMCVCVRVRACMHVGRLKRRSWLSIFCVPILLAKLLSGSSKNNMLPTHNPLKEELKLSLHMTPKLLAILAWSSNCSENEQSKVILTCAVAFLPSQWPLEVNMADFWLTAS